MASADGLLARVKPPLGRLEAQAARQLALAAERWGNGQIELTNRGALQMRGFSEAGLAEFRQAVLAAGLASLDPALERRRNLILSPLASACCAALAGKLERWIAEDEVLAALPPKFTFAVAVPGRDPHPLPGDVRLAPQGGGWQILLAGCATAGLTQAPLAAAQAIAHRFLTLAAGLDDPPRRMADLVRRCGHEAVFAEVNVTLQEAPAARGAATPAVAGRLGEAFALGVAFGAFTAKDLSRAADLAERFADGRLRVSPWRALVLVGVAETAHLSAAAHAAGFVVDSADPRLNVSACAGAPGCASAHASTRADAAIVAARRLAGHVHLSGCAKGCAHPAPAAFTLVAAPDGYGLVRHGHAGDPPERRGLTLDQSVRRLVAGAAKIP
jgi:precorrin-3B synthase